VFLKPPLDEHFVPAFYMKMVSTVIASSINVSANNLVARVQIPVAFMTHHTKAFAFQSVSHSF